MKPLPRWPALCIAVAAAAVAVLQPLRTAQAAGAPVEAVASRDGAAAVRIKDLGRLEGWRDNALVGYGLVTGLAGTGDSPRNRATRQSIANMMSRFDMVTPSGDVNSRNVATVMLTASLPVYARQGDRVDVTVTSIGDARSLAGGTLIMAPLKAANGRTYALAQGALTVGGYRHDANGNLVQKNHPTVGLISGGAVVEVAAPREPAGEPGRALTFVLHQPDFTTATRVADGINAALGQPAASARDAAGVEIHAPQLTLAALMARIESISVTPDRRARVVINERTGTVVSGGDVRVAPVTITHGDLKVSVTAERTASQPVLIGDAGDGVRSLVLENSRLDVAESEAPRFLAAGPSTVADLVQSLVRLKVSTRDIISVLQSVKAAGALHADIVVQ
jgi:flagellar P-ring protein precursor FlgI